MAKVHPRRGYASAAAVAKTKRPDPAALWKSIRARWKPSERWSFEAKPALLVAAKRTLEDDTPPGPTDVSEHALIARLVAGWRVHDTDPMNSDLVDFWVASAGEAFATRAALGTLETKLRQRTHELHPKSATLPDARWDASTPSVLPRLRFWLSIATDDAYAAARAVAAELRDSADADADADMRAATAFLFPTETAWVDASAAELTGTNLDDDRLLILSSVSDPTAARKLLGNTRPIFVQGGWMGRTNQLPSLMEALGAELTEDLVRWLVDDDASADMKKELFAALALLPGRRPMNALLDLLGEKYALPAALEAVHDRPHLATRLLTARIAARAANQDATMRLLHVVMSKHPEVVEVLRPHLDEAQREVLEDAAAARDAAPPAPNDALPAILVNPPWAQKKKRAKALVVKDVAPLDRPPTMSWAPGEREKWAASHRPPGYAVNVSDEEWTQKLAALRAGTLSAWEHERLLVGAPDAVAEEAVKDWLPGDPWYAQTFLRAAIARLELRTAEAIDYFLGAHLKDALGYIGPFDVPAFAPYVADAFHRLKSAREDARQWMERHATATAIGVVPNAVGKAGPARRAGEAALRYLVSIGQEAVVHAVATEYGEAVLDAVTQLLAIDPSEVLPTKIPKLPSFFDADLLPAPLLIDRAHSLSIAAVTHLGTMLAISKPGEEYVGLDEVIAICDPDSLARFAWELFEAWQAAGSPSKESWAFHALALFGDDETARRLTPLIRKWPGDGGHARAVAGLDVLRAIGTDVALMHLHGIAQKVKFKGLQKNAREQIERIARDRDLSPEELADRLVPDLGLDENGSLVLDYGPRQFTVGFDEMLEPFVLEGKKPRKSLPKPGAKDDAEMAPAAYKRFSALKKDARTAAKGQILRLEQAMVGQRRWSGAQLRHFFLSHPLMRHLSRRLIWGRFEGDVVAETFRVAEDGSLADAHDDGFELANDAVVGIAHSLELPVDVAARWGEILGDYEILQPFVQLGRGSFEIEESESKAKALTRFEGREIDTRKVLGLEGRGWRRGPPLDAGVVGWMQKSLPGGLSACLHLDPGIFTGYIEESPKQVLQDLTITPHAESWDSTGQVEFGTLSRVTFSELVRDVTELVQS